MVNIRRIRDDDSLDQLTQLLHRAYAGLASRGMSFVASYQDVETTRSRIADGHCFVAESEGELVATITVYLETPESKCLHYLREGVARFGQFGVDPSLRGQGIGRALLAQAESFASANGYLEMALDTAEGAQDLIDLYKRWGYRNIGSVDWDLTNYVSVVMSKKL